MCGIAGFGQLESRFDEGVLQAMTETLVRRGPDDSGFFVGQGVGLGMRRLSIIDLAGSKQPLRSQGGRYIAVFNGEIYNYRELRRELQTCGYSFRTDGDGEVIVNLFEKDGVSAFSRLRGMFAIAIWDNDLRELTLVRDPLGIKPVFYSQQAGDLVFGSEIKSLLPALPLSLTVDAQAVDAILAYTYIPAPLTIWKHVRKLRPGHLVRWKNGQLSEYRYWDLLNAAQEPAPSTEQLREALDDSIRAHQVSDVEVGAFLSGGLDSSTIVARMRRQSNAEVRAFSVKFGEKSHLFDETIYAHELSELYGFKLRVESLPTSGYQSLSDAIRAFDEPFADDSVMPTDAICRFASRDLKVVLSGAGGDEFFGGYNRYSGVVLHDQLTSLPRWLVNAALRPTLSMASRFLGSGTRRGDLCRRFTGNLSEGIDQSYRGYLTSLDFEARKAVISPALLGQIDEEKTVELIAEHQRRAAHLCPLKRAMYVDVNTYLPEDVLALSDRIGMWHSLEIRTPLADRSLAEFAFRLRPDELVSIRQKKIALRRAVAKWLPKSILRHPKQGFEGPTAAWLRAEGSTYVRDRLRDQQESGTHLVQSQSVESLLAQHVAGEVDFAKPIFSCLAILEWASLNKSRISDFG